MLDNFSPDELVSAAKAIKQDWQQNGGQEAESRCGAKRCLVEVSGGLTEENMDKWLCDGECRDRDRAMTRISFVRRRKLRLTGHAGFFTWQMSISCPPLLSIKVCLR